MILFMLKIFQSLLAAHIPLFLYPFLHTVSKTRPFEYLRLTSLGVIGALVKVSLLYSYLTHIPLFLYPFLHTVSKTQPFEYLRLTSLGVTGALVKESLLYTLPILTYSQ